MLISLFSKQRWPISLASSAFGCIFDSPLMDRSMPIINQRKAAGCNRAKLICTSRVLTRYFQPQTILQKSWFPPSLPRELALRYFLSRWCGTFRRNEKGWVLLNVSLQREQRFGSNSSEKIAQQGLSGPLPQKYSGGTSQHSWRPRKVAQKSKKKTLFFFYNLISPKVIKSYHTAFFRKTHINIHLIVQWITCFTSRYALCKVCLPSKQKNKQPPNCS